MSGFRKEVFLCSSKACGLTSAEFSSSHDSKRHQAEDASEDQEAEGAHEQAGFLEAFEEGELFVALDFDVEERGEDEDEGSGSGSALKFWE